MSADPASIGARVLANLARGRELNLARRQQRAAELRELVLRAERLDRASGQPTWGRRGRIARRLKRDGVSVSARWVAGILLEASAHSSDLGIAGPGTGS
jgi:hypothetical protein